MRSRFGILAFAFAVATLMMAPARAEMLRPLTCHSGDYMVGVGGRVGNWVNLVYPLCAHFNSAKSDFDPPYPGDAFGDQGGAPQEDRCGPRNVVVHIESKQRNDIKDMHTYLPKMQYVAFTCMPALFLFAKDPANHGITSTVPEDGPGGAGGILTQFSDCEVGQQGIGLNATLIPDAPNYHDPYAARVEMRCSDPVQAETTTSLPVGAKKDTNYLGSDIAGSGPLSVNDPSVCYNNCVANSNCMAWTYVHPGVQRPSAVCYLKNPVPSATASDCCISGVVRVSISKETYLKLLKKIHP